MSISELTRRMCDTGTIMSIKCVEYIIKKKGGIVGLILDLDNTTILHVAHIRPFFFLEKY